MLYYVPYSAKFWQGKIFDEFGKADVICQYFTQPNSIFSKVAIIIMLTLKLPYSSELHNFSQKKYVIFDYCFHNRRYIEVEDMWIQKCVLPANTFKLQNLQN